MFICTIDLVPYPRRFLLFLWTWDGYPVPAFLLVLLCFMFASGFLYCMLYEYCTEIDIISCSMFWNGENLMKEAKSSASWLEKLYQWVNINMLQMSLKSVWSMVMQLNGNSWLMRFLFSLKKTIIYWYVNFKVFTLYVLLISYEVISDKIELYSFKYAFLVTLIRQVSIVLVLLIKCSSLVKLVKRLKTKTDRLDR